MDTLPNACPRLPIRGVARALNEDFEVDEHLGFAPSGEGEHLYLRIEKRGLNTFAVARAVADAAGVAVAEVGFAGLKDRWAMTRQWFSVPAPAPIALPKADNLRVLEQTRHARKLRRGQHAGNRFRLVLRDLRGPVDLLEARLFALARGDVPNYFGPQRFGRDGCNVEAAWAWLGRRPRRKLPPYLKGIYLSTARALLFNAVLAERVREGRWNTPVDGDVLADGVPTGPLWGRGRSPSAGASASIEAKALSTLRDWLDPLEHVGLVQQRRNLAVRPRDLGWIWRGDTLTLRFGLPPGSYATSVLSELGEFSEPAR